MHRASLARTHRASYPAYSRPLLAPAAADPGDGGHRRCWSACGLRGSTTSPYFDSPLTLDFLLLDITPILLIALPMTLIIITGEIDLSVASVVGPEQRAGRRAPPGGWPRSRRPAWSPCWSALLCGALNGFLVAVRRAAVARRHHRHAGALPRPRRRAARHQAVTDFPETWTDLANANDRRAPAYPMVIDPGRRCSPSCSRSLLHFTPFGRGIYAIGLNTEAAHFTGVNVAAHQAGPVRALRRRVRARPASTTRCASAAPAATTPPAWSCR